MCRFLTVHDRWKGDLALDFRFVLFWIRYVVMADTDEPQRVNNKPKGKAAEKVHPAQIFAEDMSEEWSKDAIKAARDAFALTIASGDVHATIADFIRKKFDRDHERGWNCIVGRSFGCFCTHEIKTYMYFTVQPGTYVLLWRS